MKIKSLLVIAVLATAILCFGAPGIVKGVTIEDLIAQIAQLQAQLDQLQNQETTTPTPVPTTTAWCHTFNTNMGYGAQGADYDALITVLDKEGIGEFTPENKPAKYNKTIGDMVVKLQKKYGISRTGYVGLSTRAKLNQLYGCQEQKKCTPNWQCQWGTCQNGYRSQVAVDANNCGLSVSSAIVCTTLAQACVSSDQPGIQSSICEKMWDNGNPDNRVDIVLIPDGFGDMTTWTASVDKLMNEKLFSVEPLKSNKNKFNIWRADVLNNEVATVYPGYNYDISFAKIKEQAEGCVNPDLTIVIRNIVMRDYKVESGETTTEYAFVSEKLIISTNYNAAGLAVAHEFGHAFANLGDEYPSIGQTADFSFRPNVDVEGCPKWCSGTLNESSPFYNLYTQVKECIQANSGHGAACSSLINDSQGNTLVGIFEDDMGTSCLPGYGCYWNAKSFTSFKSSKESIMKSTASTTFNEVSKNAILNKINELTGQTQPTITVTSPNGGETWAQGSTHNITWTSSGVDNVMIELDKNSLVTGWHLIYSVPASAGSYSWTVPSSGSAVPPIGLDYKIKIWDTTNSSITDSSDNYFTIVAPTTQYSLNISGVTGMKSVYALGEKISFSVKGIELDGTAASSEEGFNIQAYICKNGDCNNYLPPNPASSYNGNYNSLTGLWDVSMYAPSDTVPAYSMKVVLYCSQMGSYCWNHYSQNGQVEKLFNFIVVSSTQPSITVTSPNGGEQWQIGKTYDITWTSNKTDRAYISWHGYNSSGQETGAFVINTETPANVGKFSWTIPQNVVFSDKERSKILISLSATATTSSSADQDVSDNYFTIIASPCTDTDGGKDYFTKGTVTRGTTTYTDLCYANMGKVFEYYCKEDGTSTGEWYACPNGCADNGACKPSTQPSITVTSPNGGEQWKVGETHNITWNSSYPFNSTIQIGIYDTRYDTEGGPRSEMTIINTTNNGNYSWTIPSKIGNLDLTVTDSPVYKIKIYVNGGGEGKMDQSDNTFTIVAPTQLLSASSATIIGNQSTYATGQTINFSVKGVASDGNPGDYTKGFNVQAYICKNGDCNNYLPPNPPGSYNGNYNSSTGYWDVSMIAPTDTTATYTMKVAFYCSRSPQSGYSGSCVAQSEIDKTFSFTVSSSTQPSITVTSPNGGETWKVGETHDITWASTGLGSSMVEIYLQIDLSNTPNVVSYVPASAGTYSWTIPAQLSGQNTVGINKKIYIRSMNNTTIGDYSDNYFTIVAPTTLPLVASCSASPNPAILGQTLVTFMSSASGGTGVYSSSWSGSSCSGQGMTCSKSFLSAGTYIAHLTVTSGSQTATADCSVVVNAATQPSITVTSPNGGETWAKGSTHTITWTSSYAYNYYNIVLASGSNTLETGIANCPGLVYAKSLGVTPSQNSFSWTVDSDIPVGSDYKIVVYCDNMIDPTCTRCNSSNNYFSIVAPVVDYPCQLQKINGEIIMRSTISNQDQCIVSLCDVYGPPNVANGISSKCTFQGVAVKDYVAPIAHYTFDTDVKDSSGNGYNGIIKGGVVLTDGKSGKAYQFDGTSGYIVIAGPNNNNGLALGSAITLSAWIKIQSGGPQYQGIVKRGNYGASYCYQEYALLLDSGKITLVFGDGTNSNSISGGLVNDGQWHMVTGVLKPDNTMEIYVDGSLKNSGTKTITGVPGFTFQAIGTLKTNNWFLGGLIDDVRIYDKALTENEITSLYNNLNNLVFTTSPVVQPTESLLASMTDAIAKIMQQIQELLKK
jgi:hypothetical protein